MPTKDEEFVKRLRATFKVEAEEHVQAMATAVMELEQSPGHDAQRRLIETVFRAAHSLKGAARAVDFTDIESRCQSLEDIFAAWKRQESAPTRGALDTVHRTLDAVSAALAVPGPLREPSSTPDQSSSAGRPVSVAAETVSAAPAPAERTFSPEDTVRITVAKLNARLLEAEEMLTAKLTIGQRAEDVRALGNRCDAWRKEWTTVEPAARALRQGLDRPAPGPATTPPPGLMRVLEFLDWNLDHLESLERHATALIRTANQDRQVIGKLVDDLLAGSKELLLLPFATLAAPFPKLVRDLCHDQGKEADLVVRGDEVEIDKRILEEMKAPLIHLLRNCVDHGIETPEERRRSGKPSRATITLAASQVNGSKVMLLMSDDGAGIDADKVKASALEHGILSPDVARQLTDAEAQRLVFEADVTTSPMITRLSGRGLGLAIVREKAEKLGGVVSIESQLGRGAQFSIVLPSTLTTFRGILVEAAQRPYVIPTLQVERVARVNADEIRTVEGRATVSLSGRAIALVQLADVLEAPHAKSNGEAHAPTLVLVLGAGDQRVAFAVDAAHDEQEVLVKPLRAPLSRVRNIAGATVLGSGQVAPILNVSDLLRSARKFGNAGARTAADARPAHAEAHSVLVAEDSITSRMLLKSILQSAGYKVKTAVDGMEAFALLRTEPFDLVVSDVEMPRLNGFDLTARIRADKKLAELPVVLVTALETREDRERGIDVGANAYIIKSNFDQSHLLDVLKRLV
jgi:two-component system, chemotaxis family, sensor kinase CheA